MVYGTTAQATDVSGTIRIDAGALKLVNARAGLGQGSEAKAAGGLTFDARAAAPFALEADVAVNEFDPAPWLLALNPRQPATVEGKFTVSTKVSGRAASLAALAEGAHGSFQLTSKGGKFRGLPVGFATKTEAAGKIAAVSSILGNALGAVTGRKDASDIAGKAQAVAEFAALLGAIPYDQLSVVLERDAALNTQIKDFALLSPEMRLTGAGRTTHRTGASLLEDALALEFKLRARGRTAELLKYLGRLDPPPDELGYAACTLPLKVGGTLAKIDTSELNTAIAALAIEKSGAGELLNKLRGGGKE